MTKNLINIKLLDKLREDLPQGSQVKIAKKLRCSTKYVGNVLMGITAPSTDLTLSIIEMAMDMKKVYDAKKNASQKKFNRLLSEAKA